MDLQLIKDKKFKKNIIKINFIREVSSLEVTKLNLLLYVLLTASKKYKTNRELIIASKNLYDLTPESFVNIYGTKAVLTFRTTFLKDKYSEENNSLNAVKFINEILFNPFVENSKFDSKTFNIAKNQLIDDIKTYRENKAQYSVKRMIKAMDINSPYAIDDVGSLEDLENINESNLYEFYLDVINNSVIDVVAFGDFKEEDLKELKIKMNFKKMNFIYRSNVKKNKEVIEKDNNNQSKLVMGYTLNNIRIKEAEYALQVYLYILGASATSKLFMNVREKKSLCYTIFASAKYSGSLMIITAGIDDDKFKSAVELIKKEVLDMELGNISESEIEEAKINIKVNNQELLENPYTIISSYESQKYFGFDKIKTRIKNIDKVTKEDIIKVAKKIKLNTIYLLEGTEK